MALRDILHTEVTFPMVGGGAAILHRFRAETATVRECVTPPAPLATRNPKTRGPTRIAASRAETVFLANSSPGTAMMRSGAYVTLAVGLLVLSSATKHESSTSRPLVVGGIPLFSETDFVSKWRPTFETHLSNALGREFTLVPLSLDSTFRMVQEHRVDFVFGNPSIASCLEAEFQVEITATLRNSVLGDEASQFAGVIFARSDNMEVNGVGDLRGKILEASSIFVTGSGLLQWQEMRFHGLDMFADSSQVRFVGADQSKIVYDVLQRKADVGFVRSGIIEQMVAENLTEWEDFKIINLQPAEARAHSLTQVASTAFVPEWPLMATAAVSRELRAAVSLALSQISSSHPAAIAAGYAAWDMPKSYSAVSVSMWDVGILREHHRSPRRCVRGHDLYDVITCPSTGHFKRSRAELSTRCDALGLACPTEYQCVCSPCVKADEIAVSAVLDGNRSQTVTTCRKMEVCATVQQGQKLKFELEDNQRREQELRIALKLHAPETVAAHAVRTDLDSVYQADLSSTRRGRHLLAVKVHGEELPNSPFFVEIIDRDCAGEHGGDSFRVADETGVCVCGANTFEIRGYCVHSTVLLRTFLLQLLGCALLLAGSHRLLHSRQRDELGQLSIHRRELALVEPIEVIGKGQRSVVVKAKLRGCDVAVKCFARDLAAVTNGRSGAVDCSDAGGSPWAEWFQAVEGASSDGSCRLSSTSRGSETNVQDGTDALSRSQGPTSAPGLRPTPGRLSRPHSLTIMSPSRVEPCQGSLMRRLSVEDLGIAVTQVLQQPGSPHSSLASSPGARRSSSSAYSRTAMQVFQKEMRQLVGLRHSCIATLMGVVADDGGPPLIVSELMEHGSLRALLNNKCLELDSKMVAPITRDVIQGMAYLHASDPPIVHGDLKSDNILVDRNFRAKVADFSLSYPYPQEGGPLGTPPWMAPELLQSDQRKPSTMSDVYAFGIVLWELETRAVPYAEEMEAGLRPAQILEQVREGVLRPSVPAVAEAWVSSLMQRCWAHTPADRPTFADLDKEVSAMNIVSFHAAAVSCLERFKANLDKSEAVLRDLFPSHVVQQLLEGKAVRSERKEEVTIFFSDIVGFTDISARLEPDEVSEMLHRLYQKLDALAKQHRVFKMGIIGDAWMGVTNVDGDQPDEHATLMAQFALAAVEAARHTPVREGDDAMGFVRIRAGFHTGPVVADVVGTHNLQYCLFGDTVNTASRMESTSEAMRVQCSSVAASKLQLAGPAMPLTVRGRIAVKGKGTMTTFWVGEGPPVTRVCSDSMLDVGDAVAL